MTKLNFKSFFLYFTEERKENAPAQAVRPGVRQAAGVRRARQRRNRVDNDQQNHGDTLNADDDADDEEIQDPVVDMSRYGAKKRAKLEAKAEKKAQREIDDRDRENRRRQEQQKQEERDRLTAKEREEERKQEEAEKALREEKERREQEEYQRMKEAFTVEDEGFEENEDFQKNLLDKFVNFVKHNKVVVLEDLAAHFHLKIASVIDRVKSLQEEGVLTGVIDDRGKFIYISEEEMLAVSKFVRQQGRISITELAGHSNNLINLNPGNRVLEAK